MIQLVYPRLPLSYARVRIAEIKKAMALGGMPRSGLWPETSIRALYQSPLVDESPTLSASQVSARLSGAPSSHGGSSAWFHVFKWQPLIGYWAVRCTNICR